MLASYKLISKGIIPSNDLFCTEIHLHANSVCTIHNADSDSAQMKVLTTVITNRIFLLGFSQPLIPERKISKLLAADAIGTSYLRESKSLDLPFSHPLKYLLQLRQILEALPSSYA